MTSKVKVQAIVTHHAAECEPYLIKCLQSIYRQRIPSEEMYVYVVSGRKVSETVYLQCKTYGFKLVEDETLNTAYKKLQSVINKTDSELLLLISDDVVLEDRCIENMLRAFSVCSDIGALGPFGNNDNGTQYLYPAIPKETTIQNVDGVLREMEILGMKTSLLMPAPSKWVPFWCVMIQRSVWNELGGTDEALDFRHNDQDFCLRARYKLKKLTFYELSALAWHFGSKTIPNHGGSSDVLDEASRKWEEKLKTHEDYRQLRESGG